jgi:RNA polymerase sigma-70 factor, ECF subfamily
MDDEQAVRCLKRGDMDGLEALVLRYQLKAGRVAFLVTHDEALAQDVVQETFISIYRRIGQFDETRPFEPYFMRSVVNAALNATRGRKSLSLESDPAGFEELLAQAASVESEVEFAQVKRDIFSALAQLSPRQRAVIVQRYYLEMSEKEMAESLQAAPGTVKWLLNAARARLRGLLGGERSAE